jgi:hypothetical protein
MTDDKIIIIEQLRHQRLHDLINEYNYLNKPVLIYSPFATDLKKIRFSNVFIAPDTAGKDYISYILDYTEKQKNIYFPIYQFIKQKLKHIIPKPKRHILESIKLN